MFKKGKSVIHGTPSKPAVAVDTKSTGKISAVDDSKAAVLRSLLGKSVSITSPSGASERRVDAGKNERGNSGLNSEIICLDDSDDQVDLAKSLLPARRKRVEMTSPGSRNSAIVLENEQVQLPVMCLPISCDPTPRLVLAVNMLEPIEDPVAEIQALGGVECIKSAQHHPVTALHCKRVFEKILHVKNTDTEGILSHLLEDEEKLGNLVRVAQEETVLGNDQKLASFIKPLELEHNGVSSRGGFNTNAPLRLVLKVVRRKKRDVGTTSVLNGTSVYKDVQPQLGIGFPECLGKKADSTHGLPQQQLNYYEDKQEPIVNYERLIRQRKRGGSASLSRAEQTELSHSVSATPRIQRNVVPWLSTEHKNGQVNVSNQHRSESLLNHQIALPAAVKISLIGLVKNTISFTEPMHLHTNTATSGYIKQPVTIPGTILVSEQEKLHLDRSGMDALVLDVTHLQGHGYKSVLDTVLTGGMSNIDSAVYPVFQKDELIRQQTVNMNLGKLYTGIIEEDSAQQTVQEKNIGLKVQKQCEQLHSWMFDSDEECDDTDHNNSMNDEEEQDIHAKQESVDPSAHARDITDMTNTLAKLSLCNYKLQSTRVTLAMKNQTAPTSSHISALLGGHHSHDLHSIGNNLSMRGLISLLRIADLYEDPAESPQPQQRSMNGSHTDEKVKYPSINAVRINSVSDLVHVMQRQQLDIPYGPDQSLEHIDRVDGLLPESNPLILTLPFDVDFTSEPQSQRIFVSTDSKEENSSSITEDAILQSQVGKTHNIMLHRLENVILQSIRVAIRAQGLVLSKQQTHAHTRAVRVCVHAWIDGILDRSQFIRGITVHGLYFKATSTELLSIQFIQFLGLHLHQEQVDRVQFHISQWEDLKWLFLNFLDYPSCYQVFANIAPTLQSLIFSVFIYFSMYRGLFVGQYLPQIPAKLDVCMKALYKHPMLVLIYLQVVMQPTACRYVSYALTEQRACDEKQPPVIIAESRKVPQQLGMVSRKAISINMYLSHVIDDTMDATNSNTNSNSNNNNSNTNNNTNNTTKEESIILFDPSSIVMSDVAHATTNTHNNNSDDDNLIIEHVILPDSTKSAHTTSTSAISHHPSLSPIHQEDTSSNQIHHENDDIPHYPITTPSSSIPCLQIQDLFPQTNIPWSMFGLLFLICNTTQYPSIPLNTSLLIQSQLYPSLRLFHTAVLQQAKHTSLAINTKPLYMKPQNGQLARICYQKSTVVLTNLLQGHETPNYAILQAFAKLCFNITLPSYHTEETRASRIISEFAYILFSQGIPCCLYMSTDVNEFITNHITERKESNTCQACGSTSIHQSIHSYLLQLEKSYEPSIYPHISKRLLLALSSCQSSRQIEGLYKNIPMNTLDITYRHNNICLGVFQTFFLLPTIVDRTKNTEENKTNIEIPLNDYVTSKLRNLCRSSFVHILSDIVKQPSNIHLTPEGALWSNLEKTDIFSSPFMQAQALANLHSIVLQNITSVLSAEYIKKIDAHVLDLKQHHKGNAHSVKEEMSESVCMLELLEDSIVPRENEMHAILEEIEEWILMHAHSSLYQYKHTYTTSTKLLDGLFTSLTALEHAELDLAPGLQVTSMSMPTVLSGLGLVDGERGENQRKYTLKTNETSKNKPGKRKEKQKFSTKKAHRSRGLKQYTIGNLGEKQPRAKKTVKFSNPNSNSNHTMLNMPVTEQIEEHSTEWSDSDNDEEISGDSTTPSTSEQEESDDHTSRNQNSMQQAQFIMPTRVHSRTNDEHTNNDDDNQLGGFYIQRMDRIPRTPLLPPPRKRKHK